MQYFIGLEEFKTEAPFDSSLMVHFRKRLGVDEIIDINEMICRAKAEDENKDINDDDNDHEPQSPDSENTTQETDDKQSNKGTLILDATCAPADIRYPTDLSLLNEARMKLEEIIDTLHKPLRGKGPNLEPTGKWQRLEFLAVPKNEDHQKKNQIRKGYWQATRLYPDGIWQQLKS